MRTLHDSTVGKATEPLLKGHPICTMDELQDLGRVIHMAVDCHCQGGIGCLHAVSRDRNTSTCRRMLAKSCLFCTMCSTRSVSIICVRPVALFSGKGCACFQSNCRAHAA
eukprot:5904998-Amphidinium_carterae.1